MRAIALATLLVATFSVSPVQADVPDEDGVCDGDEAATVQCKVVLGPLSATLKGVVTLGVAFCQEQTFNLPVYCDGPPGDITGFGGQAFGDPTWMGGRFININVVLDQGTCTDLTSPPCGFQVDICNDADQNSICTNVNDQDDDLYETAASQGIGGACKDEKKDCQDPNEAGWEGCMDESVFGDWSAEQIIVFIGTEAGPSIDPPDVQAAVSAGTYTIWVKDDGQCFEPTASNKDEQTLQEWRRL